MPLNYSKWDNIELSDDEDNFHPNIDNNLMIRLQREKRQLQEEVDALRAGGSEAAPPPAKANGEDIEALRAKLAAAEEAAAAAASDAEQRIAELESKLAASAFELDASIKEAAAFEKQARAGADEFVDEASASAATASAAAALAEARSDHEAEVARLTAAHQAERSELMSEQRVLEEKLAAAEKEGNT